MAFCPSENCQRKNERKKLTTWNEIESNIFFSRFIWHFSVENKLSLLCVHWARIRFVCASDTLDSSLFSFSHFVFSLLLFYSFDEILLCVKLWSLSSQQTNLIANTGTESEHLRGILNCCQRMKTIPIAAFFIFPFVFLFLVSQCRLHVSWRANGKKSAKTMMSFKHSFQVQNIYGVDKEMFTSKMLRAFAFQNFYIFVETNDIKIESSRARIEFKMNRKINGKSRWWNTFWKWWTWISC